MKSPLNWKALCVVALMTLSLPVLAENSSKDMTNTMKDTVITTKVKSALAASDVTHSLNISVETNNGIVTLGGTTKSDTEAAMAIQIAESTADVVEVNTDKLMVSNDSSNSDTNKQLIADSYITAKVKGTFIRNNINLTSGTENVPVARTAVETKQGVVYLSGNVDHQSQIELAVKLAKSVSGVKDVVSDIKVKI